MGEKYATRRGADGVCGHWAVCSRVRGLEVLARHAEVAAVQSFRRRAHDYDDAERRQLHPTGDADVAQVDRGRVPARTEQGVHQLDLIVEKVCSSYWTPVEAVRKRRFFSNEIELEIRRRLAAAPFLVRDFSLIEMRFSKEVELQLEAAK